jgi:hypothetical protein
MSSAEATLAGAKAAAVATIASAIPTVSYQHKFQLFFPFPEMQACSHLIAKQPCTSLTYRFAAVLQLASVRMLPWAKANINPTGQALIISTVAGMAYFIAADKKILSLARRHSFEEAPEHLRNTSFQGTGRLHPAFFRP